MPGRLSYFRLPQLSVLGNVAITTGCEVMLWYSVLEAYRWPYDAEGSLIYPDAIGFFFGTALSALLYLVTVMLILAMFWSDPGVIEPARHRGPDSLLAPATLEADLPESMRAELEAALDAAPADARWRIMSADDTRARFEAYDPSGGGGPKAPACCDTHGGDGNSDEGASAVTVTDKPVVGAGPDAACDYVVVGPDAAWRDRRCTPMLRDGSKWCRTCLVWRPSGASHCGELGRCVEGFDHFCPAVGNAVGAGNHAMFSWMTVAAAGLVSHGLLCGVGHVVRLVWRSMAFTGVSSSEAFNTTMPALVLVGIIIMVVRPLAGPAFRGIVTVAVGGCALLAAAGSAAFSRNRRRRGEPSTNGKRAGGQGSAVAGCCRRSLLRCGACLDSYAGGLGAQSARSLARSLGARAAGAREKKAEDTSPLAEDGPGMTGPAAGSSAAPQTLVAAPSAVAPLGPPASDDGPAAGSEPDAEAGAGGGGAASSPGDPPKPDEPASPAAATAPAASSSQGKRKRPSGSPVLALVANAAVVVALVAALASAVAFAPAMLSALTGLTEAALKPRFTDISDRGLAQPDGAAAAGELPGAALAAGAAQATTSNAAGLARKYAGNGTAEAIEGPWGMWLLGAAFVLLWCCSRMALATCSGPMAGMSNMTANPFVQLCTACGCCPGAALGSDFATLVTEVIASVAGWGAAACILLPRWWYFDPTGRYEMEFAAWEGPWSLAVVAVGAALTMMMVPFAISHWLMVTNGETTKGQSSGNPFSGDRWPLALWLRPRPGDDADAAGVVAVPRAAHDAGRRARKP